MTFQTIIEHQSLLLNGKRYSAAAMSARNKDKSKLVLEYEEIYGRASFEVEVATFLEEWFNGNERLMVKTSGSTGTPKPMMVEKQKMMNSACMTLEFLRLQPNDRALLAMPVQYIAGKMMVVRALVGGLHLFTRQPSAHPLATFSQPLDFLALTPMQVYSSLTEPTEKERLQSVRQLIIGGGAVDTTLQKQLGNFPYEVWSTYGMTETLSHIALRRLNGDTAGEWYEPFRGVMLSTSDEGTLIIDAPHVHEGQLLTNDRVEWNEKGHFKIIGRKDNIINSGGIKIQIEEVEKWIAQRYNKPFTITSVPHPKWGEMVVMLITDEENKEQLESVLKSSGDYRLPKMIFKVDALPTTETGKPDRHNAKRLASTIYNEIRKINAD